LADCFTLVYVAFQEGEPVRLKSCRDVGLSKEPVDSFRGITVCETDGRRRREMDRYSSSLSHAYLAGPIPIRITIPKASAQLSADGPLQNLQ